MDPVEQAFEAVLDGHRIRFSRPERDAAPHSGRPRLDYFLLDYGVYVEVKAWSSERLHKQLRESGKEADGIIVLIGIPAVRAFGLMLSGHNHRVDVE